MTRSRAICARARAAAASDGSRLQWPIAMASSCLRRKSAGSASSPSSLRVAESKSARQPSIATFIACREIGSPRRSVDHSRVLGPRTDVGFPLPVIAPLGLCNEVIGIPRPLAPSAIDVGLAIKVKLLERYGWTRPLQTSCRKAAARSACCAALSCTSPSNTIRCSCIACVSAVGSGGIATGAAVASVATASKPRSAGVMCVVYVVLRAERYVLHPSYQVRCIQSRRPRTQLSFIMCGDDAKHHCGVLGAENKILRAKYDWRANVAKCSYVVLSPRSLKSAPSQLGGRLLGCAARVCGPHEQLGVLPEQKPSGLGDRVRRMFEQACLRLMERHQRLLRRPRHGQIGATVKVTPHRPVCRSQAQPLPFLRPPDCGRDGLARSDTHTSLGRKKSASSVRRMGLRVAW